MGDDHGGVPQGLTVETWGNISARDPETGLVYLTPSAMQYDTITVDDVVVAELDGKIVQGTRKPTIETGMHLAVYRARKDVNAVIHTHPTYSMVYSCQGKDIPLFMDEAAQLMGDTCHTTPYALPGSQELADAVAASKARIAELEEQKNAVKAEAAEEAEAEPAAKACPVCGAESDSKFCPKCGAPME